MDRIDSCDEALNVKSQHLKRKVHTTRPSRPVWQNLILPEWSGGPVQAYSFTSAPTLKGSDCPYPISFLSGPCISFLLLVFSDIKKESQVWAWCTSTWHPNIITRLVFWLTASDLIKRYLLKQCRVHLSWVAVLKYEVQSPWRLNVVVAWMFIWSNDC